MVCLVHKKGYKEGSAAHGQSRAVSKEDFAGALSMLKQVGWEFELNTKEVRQLEGGSIPQKIKDKVRKAISVLQGFFYTFVTVAEFENTSSTSTCRGSMEHFLLMQYITSLKHQ